MEKERFGYDHALLIYIQNDTKAIPPGSFSILTRSGKMYWYYGLSTGKNRLIYLCSVDNKGEERNSFLNSVKILQKKLKGGVSSVKKSLIDEIDTYIELLNKEKDNKSRGVERTKKTIQDIISHIRRFREYVSNNPIGTKQVERDDFREYVSSYITYLIELGQAPNTTRVHIIHLKQFLDHLVEPVFGRRVINNHSITQTFLKSQFAVRREENKVPSFFTEDKYISLLKFCSINVRRVWRDYIKTGVRPHISEMVYFSSLLQLLYGFRIGELIKCYRNKEVKDASYKGKGGYTYLVSEGNGYIIDVFWKNRFGSVYIDFEVYSWSKPSTEVKHRSFLDSPIHKKETYATHIIDVLTELFPSDRLLFPIDVDTLRKFFKVAILDGAGASDMGLEGTHDLRDMMINYELHIKGTSFLDLSQITRNKVSTIEKYYLHSSRELSVSKTRKLNTKDRLKDLSSYLNSVD